jgi:hypothetical protein
MDMNKLTQNNFIQRIESKFGKGKFDYSLLQYKDAHSNVKLICKNCSNIEDKPPTVWYKGFGCLKCQIRRPNPKQITKDQFIDRANKIHNFKYDYSNVVFTNIYDDVEIICPNHGFFFQKPSIHMYAKSNCPECNIYKGEEKVGIWLNINNITYVYQYKVKIEDSYHYYDFYLPKYNTIIEYNGLQHYKPIKFFGGQKGFDYLQSRDKIKEQYCLDNDIKLIIISYKDNIEETLKTLNV